MSTTEPTIASIEASAYTVPTDGPEADGTLAWDSTTLMVVEARSEHAVGTGWTWAPAAAAYVVRDILAPIARGRSALAPADVQAALVAAARNAGRPGLVGMAISAVDIALWDLGARLHDVSLTTWWGATSRPVPIYGSGGFTSYADDRLRTQLEGWLALGIPRVKIKIGESWGRRVPRDLERTALARSVVGDEVELYVDANGAYRARQACRVGRRLDELGVTWFEEPVSSDDTEGLRRVRASVDAEVAAGEYTWTLADAARIVPVVDCLQVDVTRCGGYTEWFRIAALAAAHGLEVSAHCAPYLSAPVAAATRNFRHIEWFHDHVRIARDLVEGYADPVEGALVPREEPGHGLRLRADRAAAYRVA